MALVLANRVQESATANTTVSFTLTGAVTGFQTFAVIGDTNTTYYSATDTTGQWEVGLGTYSTTGPTLTRTTIYASSNSGSAVTFSGTVSVFVTYPSGKSVNLDGSGNVSALGTVASGTWQGSTIGVAYGGTGVTTSSGANSVMLRDANQNTSINRLNQANTATTAAGGTTALTAASSYSQTLNGTGGQTYTMPDATTLTTGVAFIFNNNATGTLTLRDYASGLIGTVTSGGACELVLLSNGTVGGTWDVHGFLPEDVTWGTNSLTLGSTVITGGTWQGGTIQPGYGGTGLTTFVGANNALYSTGASTLTAGTLPIAAGGTGATSASAARTSLGLGTIATQDANNVAITGGSVNGTTIGASTASTGAFTSLTDSGNLTFTGTGNRITGDFSNATFANRVYAQSSTTNGSTSFGVIPNGTAPSSAYNAFANSDPTNTSFAQLRVGTDTSDVRLTSGITGTGTYLPMTFYAGGSEGMRLTAARDVGIGTSSPGYKLDVNGTANATAVRSGNGILVNSQTVSADYTIASGDNGLSSGPVSVASGITVTVSSGSVWTVV